MECNYANCIISLLYDIEKLDASIDPRVASFVCNVIFTRFISAQRVNAIEKSFYIPSTGIKFYKWKRTPVVTMHFQKRCISIQRYELLTRAKACIYLRLGL